MAVKKFNIEGLEFIEPYNMYQHVDAEKELIEELNPEYTHKDVFDTVRENFLKHKMKYIDIQKIEASTWNLEDEAKRKEKAQREKIRYPRMAKQMGLKYLDTTEMTVFDIGAGPLGGVSSVIQCGRRICFDPLMSEYAKFYDVSDYEGVQGEHLNERLSEADLIIVTNALDHFEDPKVFLESLKKHMKGGAYFAHFHAIDNALTHPHEAHEHNINEKFVHDVLDTDFETVWELTFKEDGLRYAWTPYNGKVGQPAFCTLFRRTTNYK